LIPKPKVVSIPPKTPVWNIPHQQISTKVSENATPIAQSRKNSSNEELVNNNK